jgi:hypothetical protein
MKDDARNHERENLFYIWFDFFNAYTKGCFHFCLFPHQQTRLKPSDFSGEKILSMPSFGWEVKPSVPCRRFATCKRSLHLPWHSHAVGKIGSAISSPYFPPSLIEVSHVAGRGAPLEMTGETKSGAERARSEGLGASGLQGPGFAPYPTLLSLTLHITDHQTACCKTPLHSRIILEQENVPKQ